jgi:N4-gp56 family major capsid protein
VANQYTSITTTPGLSDNTVKQMYDFSISAVYRETPMYRMWADKRPENVNGPAQTITLQKQQFFDSTSVTAAKTPLNEEQDVDSQKLPATLTVDLTVNEYGAAVTTTRKLKYFSFADVDAIAARTVGSHMADVMDELVQDYMVTGTQKIYAAGRANVGSVTGSDYIRATDIRKSVTWLRANKVPAFGGDFYAGGIHPHVLHDLREETGSGSWRVPNEYGTNQSNIWKGEFGEFEGVRFVQNTRTRTGTDGASSAKVYRTFILGREAIAEKVVEEPNAVVGPVVDKLTRFRTIGWYGVLGWCLYRNESIVQLLSASSTSTLQTGTP